MRPSKFKPCLDQMMAEGQAASFEQMLPFADSLLEKVGHALQIEETPANIRLLHDATLVAWLCGWLAPMRGSVMITLMKPTYTGTCQHSGCNRNDCKGNR